MKKVGLARLRILGIVFLAAFWSDAFAASDAEIPATFAGIKDAIQAYEATHPGKTLKIEELIKRLPSDFRGGFTLMYASQSTQPATPENPRVILFGDDAQTVLTYNNDLPNLELASFDQETGSLVFRTIEFPAANDGSGKANFSPPNPAACTACHGDKPHYIWGSYTQWPGAYGSLDDALPLTPGEAEHFTSFRAQAPSLPRYQELLFDPDHLAGPAPYRSLRPGRGGTSRFDYQYAVEGRPNFRLGSLLQRHQAQAAMAQIAASDRYEQLKFGLAFYLGGCERRAATDQLTALRTSNGLRSSDDYFRALGADPKVDWQLKRPPLVATSKVYNASLLNLEASLYSRLWERDLAEDPQLAPFYRPTKLADIGSKSNYLTSSSHGLAILNKIDAAGSVMVDFAGAEELLNAFVTPLRLPHLSTEDVADVCKLLLQKQLSAN